MVDAHQPKSMALIFDCFGVLAENGWGLIDDQLQPTDEQWAEMSAMSHACDKGIISIADLYTGFADVLQVTPSKIAEIVTSQRKNYPLLKAIAKLKETHKIAMLSNVGMGFIQDFFTAEELELFDALILSAEEGMAKPEPRIYHLAAKRLGVSPEDCLFIDDAVQNVRAAEEVGIQTHLYKDLAGLQTVIASQF